MSDVVPSISGLFKWQFEPEVILLRLVFALLAWSSVGSVHETDRKRILVEILFFWGAYRLPLLAFFRSNPMASATA